MSSSIICNSLVELYIMRTACFWMILKIYSCFAPNSIDGRILESLDFFKQSECQCSFCHPLQIWGGNLVNILEWSCFCYFLAIQFYILKTADWSWLFSWHYLGLRSSIWFFSFKCLTSPYILAYKSTRE